MLPVAVTVNELPVKSTAVDVAELTTTSAEFAENGIKRITPSGVANDFISFLMMIYRPNVTSEFSDFYLFSTCV